MLTKGTSRVPALRNPPFIRWSSLKLATLKGFEISSSALTGGCSATELQGQNLLPSCVGAVPLKEVVLQHDRHVVGEADGAAEPLRLVGRFARRRRQVHRESQRS